jgi:hypothetical protein
MFRADFVWTETRTGHTLIGTVTVSTHQTQQDTDKLLSARTDDLIWEHRRALTHREVVHSVARARMEVRDGYRSMSLPLPTGEEYVALVIGMARRHLHERFIAPAPSTVESPTTPGEQAGVATPPPATRIPTQAL